MKIDAEKLKKIKALAKELKYWKLKEIKVAFEYVGNNTTEYMSLDLYDDSDHPPFIRRGSDSIYPDHKIDPIVEGHKLLNDLIK